MIKNLMFICFFFLFGYSSYTNASDNEPSGYPYTLKGFENSRNLAVLSDDSQWAIRTGNVWGWQEGDEIQISWCYSNVWNLALGPFSGGGTQEFIATVLKNVTRNEVSQVSQIPRVSPSAAKAILITNIDRIARIITLSNGKKVKIGNQEGVSLLKTDDILNKMQPGDRVSLLTNNYYGFKEQPTGLYDHDLIGKLFLSPVLYNGTFVK